MARAGSEAKIACRLRGTPLRRGGWASRLKVQDNKRAAILSDVHRRTLYFGAVVYPTFLTTSTSSVPAAWFSAQWPFDHSPAKAVNRIWRSETRKEFILLRARTNKQFLPRNGGLPRVSTISGFDTLSLQIRQPQTQSHLPVTCNTLHASTK